MNTTIVNKKTDRYDVYIGRHKDPLIGKWGNPFSHREGTKAEFVVKNRTEAIAKYKEWILDQPHLMADLIELKGKRLGCWCKPKGCHGDVLVELADKAGIELF